MSLHTLTWLALFLLLACLTFRRSSWGIPLYMLAFYALPHNWWWGQDSSFMSGTRWSLLAALIFAVGILVDQRARPREGRDSSGPLLLLLLLYALNASLVHYLYAANPEQSWDGLQTLWKQLGLLFLITRAIKDPFDLKLTFYSILVGSAFVGYEVVFNDAGRWVDKRLELAIAGDAGNPAAAILAISLPLAGYLVFYGNKLEKCGAVVSAVLVLETILRINSRGVLLGMIVAALWLVGRARGRARKYAIIGIALAVVAAFMQMGDSHRARVLGRFASSFAEKEDRDQSAQDRIEYWRAAVTMISDHPLGSGHGAAFESDLGDTYIEHLGFDKQRAVHNGYLDITAGWGIQGIVLYVAAFLFVLRVLWISVSLMRARGDAEAAFFGYYLEAALVLNLIASVFTSSLDGEWFFWLMGMVVGHQYVYAEAVQTDSADLGLTGRLAHADGTH